MDGSQGVGDNALPVPSSSVTDAATAAVSSVAIAPPLAPAAPAPVSTAATQPSDFVNIKEQLVCQNPISVEPSEVSYYLPPALSDSDDAKLKDKRSSSTKKQGKSWQHSALAILKVSNPTSVDVPNIKVKVTHIEYLVRPTSFKLSPQTNYIPLLIRLPPDRSEAKMLLQEIRDGTSNKKDAKKVEAKLTLRLVDNKEKLSGRITVTYTRGGYPVFHAKDLSPDEVRLALERRGVKTVAGEFIGKGISFKKMCAILWGCCLNNRPSPETLSFRHEPDCPLVLHKGLIQLTTEGKKGKECPVCKRERDSISSGTGGLPKDLIKIIVQFTDPIL